MIFDRLFPLKQCLRRFVRLIKFTRLSFRLNSSMIFQMIFIVIFVVILIRNEEENVRKDAEKRKKIGSFVITLSGEDSRLPKMLKLFDEFGQLKLYPFYGVHGNEQFGKKRRFGLTAGQRGLRETMKQFFNMTLRENYDEVLVFQDDAIPHRNFSFLYSHLPSRCDESDLLLLGASMWHMKFSQWPPGICFDADRSTFGAYGLKVKRRAFPLILYWLDKLPHITFDHIYKYLQRSNLTVRVAYPPFLVIMDVSHKSLINNHRVSYQFSVKARAKLHHWDLKNYPISRFD